MRFIHFLAGCLFVCITSFGSLDAARAYSCDDGPVELLVERAYGVVFVRLLKTELVEVSDFGHANEIVRGEYETLMTLKGDDSNSGEVFSMPAGIGNGYVALLPGLYYLFFFNEGATYRDTPFVDMCRAKPTLYPDGEQTQEYLDEIRALAID